MAVEVVMPKLGMSMKEGSVSLWNKKVGDEVSKGEPIASINSEKIEMDLEAPADGTLIEITVQEDQGVPPGTVICYIGNPDEKVNVDSKPENTEATPKVMNDEVAATLAVEKPESTENISSQKSSIKVSPIARKMAEKAGLKLELIKGTGPKGRITKEDVEQAITNLTPEPTDKVEQGVLSIVNETKGEKMPVTGMRKIIATRMHDSLLQSAQLTINLKADVTDLIALQKQLREVAIEQYETKLSLTDLIARAVVLALQKHKNMNSAYIDDSIQTYEHVHLGIAVALENGLVVPVICHAENYSLVELSKSIKSLAQQSRDGQLSSDHMAGSTFTITNLGSYGVEHFTPILNSPEAGILGVGATTDMPVYIGEELQRRSILPLSLTFDHRVLDGAPAAEFLRTIKQLLEEPFRILL